MVDSRACYSCGKFNNAVNLRNATISTMHTPLITLSLLQNFIQNPVLARGGGGGSGGGGGGSGGGGLALIGYVPAHFSTSYLNRRYSRTVAFWGGSLVALLVTSACTFADIGFGIVVGLGAGIGVYSGLHNFVARMLSKVKQSKQVVKYAEAQDPVWQEAAVLQRIRAVFLQFQQDWSRFDLASMQRYTAPAFYEHQRLLLTAMYQMGRKNAVGNPQLTRTVIVEAIDAPNNDNDNFTAVIEASANDILIDTSSSTQLFADSSKFTEFWHFDRQGDEWVLDKITQATEDAFALNTPLENFARSHDMHFSLDMGWLLLPARGLLFGKGKFGKSDINNHVIGEWNGLLVQLYTYAPTPQQGSAEAFLVGQINLPKSYGGIIIKRRNKWELFGRAPRGYQPISFEWPDFNKRYQVYATDMDKVTSFELLNPKFMADLYDRNLSTNIEVVDNIVYFYSKETQTLRLYGDMLDVLNRAYEELKR